MNAVLEQIQKIGIVPVVVINKVEDAVPLAKALCAGGLPCAEVTFRTAAAKDAIKAMTSDVDEVDKSSVIKALSGIDPTLDVGMIIKAALKKLAR